MDAASGGCSVLRPALRGCGIGAPWRGTAWLRVTEVGRWNMFFGMDKAFRYPRSASQARHGVEVKRSRKPRDEAWF